jgi:hypothetical protein
VSRCFLTAGATETTSTELDDPTALAMRDLKSSGLTTPAHSTGPPVRAHRPRQRPGPHRVSHRYGRRNLLRMHDPRPRTPLRAASGTTFRGAR